MTGGVGPPPRDDVTAVLAVFTRGVDELVSSRQRVAEGVPQLGGLLALQNVRLAADVQYQFPAVDGDRAIGGEFLDQPPRGDLLYPRSRMRMTTSQSSVVVPRG
ncbi:hypothetical protein [Halorarius litoreus]|uniref:hypothetical protein n=1 Tax=Halorarius litoreus TaxID=2962676 RepID=UPI0020CB9F4D|nr:hypothetical protein [Halorarius litoreus]